MEITRIRIRRGVYFDTYYFMSGYADVGAVEVHNRQVKTTYYIGWKFDIPNSGQGTTAMFYTKEDAIIYSLGSVPPEIVEEIKSW